MTMDVRHAYNLWAQRYDADDNRTRDLEGLALKNTLASLRFDSCLEIGCGTGKNTSWLASRARQVTAVDFSEEMLAFTRRKVTSANVDFQQADILLPWTFAKAKYELITFSLVLEHVQHLGPVFGEAEKCLMPGGRIYVGELHPFRQYSGSKARFDTDGGRHVIRCFNHHVSDFTGALKAVGLTVVDLEEYFDGEDRRELPRILALVARKA